MNKATIPFLLALISLAGCARDSDDAGKQSANQPMPSMAEHMVRARVAATLGDQEGTKREVAAMSDSLLRTMRVPDASRPINQESARLALTRLAGVKSALWLDPSNVVLMVIDEAHHQMPMIDAACQAMDPLGDTLAVVVHVQNMAAKNSDAARTISRNCQLPVGEHALFQRPRQIDVVPADIRAQAKAQQTRR